MNKRKRIAMTTLSAVVALQCAAGSLWAAENKTVNPFVDVPAKHWAYDAVQQLVKDGIIDGYSDKTFRGDTTVTRFEMAEVVARAMTRFDKANRSNQDNIKKLQQEFALELDKMGVRLSQLEKKIDNVKWTGEIRTRYNYDQLTQGDGKEIKTSSNTARTRLMVEGIINPDWSFFGRLENTQDLRKSGANDNSLRLDYSYLEGDVGSFKVAAGRIPYMPAYGLVTDSSYNGVKVSVGNKLKASVFYGKESRGSFILADKGQNYLVTEDVLTPKFDASGGLVTQLVNEGTATSKKTEYAALLAVIDKQPNNSAMKSTALQLALAKGLQADGVSFSKTVDQNAANTYGNVLNGMLAKKPLADTDMVGMELSYALSDKTNIKAAYLTYNIPELTGPRAKMGEVGFDTQLDNDWLLKGVFARSNARDDNKAMLMGLTYKKADIKKAHSYSAYVNYFNVERLATYNSTYSVDGIANIVEAGSVNQEANLHGARGFELGLNYVFAPNILMHTNVSNMQATDQTNWKEKNIKAQLFFTF